MNELVHFTGGITKNPSLTSVLFPNHVCRSIPRGQWCDWASGIDGSRRSTKAMSDSLTFRLLVYIKAVAEAQNFTRAATQLYLAQPPLSHHIRELEASSSSRSSSVVAIPSA